MSATAKPDFGPVIARLREIAAGSSDALVPAGTPHPDAKLLSLCADITHGLKVANAANKRYDDDWTPPWVQKSQADAFALAELKVAARDADKNYSAMLRTAAKIPATTAAGIYAKALACRASKTGAVNLATSLANDLLTCPGLREILWPANRGDAP